MLINYISQLLIGFSIFSSIILLTAYLFYLPDMRKSLSGKLAGAFLLIALCALQAAHFLHFVFHADLLAQRTYGALLIVIPASFYFFSRVVLFPDLQYKAIDALHILPCALIAFLPISILPAFAFLIGAGYTFWFAIIIYRLREQRGRFKFEMFFFGMFALMALVALFMGLSLHYLNPEYFFLVYANTISLAIFAVVAALIFFPELLSDIRQITELAYAKTRLTGVDQNSKLAELEALMLDDKLYRDEELSLAQTADQVGLSAHQLSELINTAYQYGFPRFIREHRVKEARSLLIEESNASVLSIGMMIGFKSQSNFYTAFNEIVGMSPGEYRKQYLT